MARIIKRGQVWVTDLDPGFGIEIHKKRPALIVSSDILNSLWATVVIIPISTKKYFSGIEVVPVSKNEVKIDKDSFLLVPAIHAIDKSRLIKKVGRLSPDKMSEVEESVKLILGLSDILV